MKERIVGAAVLVFVAVLVVPVFLDGPASGPEMRSEPVLLPGQDGPDGDQQAHARQTIVLERDREQPVPAGGAPRRQGSEPAPATADAAPAAPDEKPQPAPQQRQTPPDVVGGDAGDGAEAQSSKPATIAAPAESATGMWAVQLGSFSDQANAERLAAGLRQQGYAAFLSRLQATSGVLHRVRVGPQKDRAGAEAVAAQLARNGHKGQVVPHP